MFAQPFVCAVLGRNENVAIFRASTWCRDICIFRTVLVTSSWRRYYSGQFWHAVLLKKIKDWNVSEVPGVQSGRGSGF